MTTEMEKIKLEIKKRKIAANPLWAATAQEVQTWYAAGWRDFKHINAFDQTAWRNALESVLSGIYDDHNGWLNQSRRSIWLEKRNSLGLPDPWPELPF